MPPSPAMPLFNQQLEKTTDALKTFEAALGVRPGRGGGAAGGGAGGPAGGQANQLGNALGGLVARIGIAGGALATLTATVGKANPGVLERFNLALGDVAGVIGQTLTPVLEGLTQAVRLVGDLLASILPSGSEVRSALAPLSDLLRDVREALAPLAPFIRDVLLVALKGLGVALQLITFPFRVLAKIIGQIFGTGEESLKSSVGAAVRSIQFTTAEAFAKSVYQAAFRGTGPQEDPRKVGGPLGEIIKLLDGVSNFLKGILDGIKNLVEQVRKVVDSLFKPAPEPVERFTKGTNPFEFFRRAPELGTRGELGGGLEGLGRLFRIVGGRRGEPDGDQRRRVDQGARRAVDGHPGGA